MAAGEKAMATAFDNPASARGEERFFFTLACIMSGVLIAGFSVNLALGRSSFDVPPVYHIHAFIFFGWIALFLTQTWLQASGNVALHKRLGWLAALWVPAMVAAGIAVTLESIRRSGGPFFFDANEFLISNPIALVAFAGMIGTAITMRKRSDWHRRLMLGAMASIMGPGFGRLVPTPLLIPWAWEITNLVGLGFVVAGMVRDKRHLGRIHPAWLVGLAVPVAALLLGQMVAYTDWGIALTKEVMAGHPGAARPMEAYLPAGMP
jgi:hypothetical protein